MHSDDIVVRKPRSIWTREVRFDFKDVVGTLLKGSMSAAFGNPVGAASSVVDLVQKLGLTTNVAALAWFLVVAATGRAVRNIAGDSVDDGEVELLVGDLELLLGEREWILDGAFIDDPGALPVVDDVAAAACRWLEARAGRSVTTEAFRDAFASAAAVEWRDRYRLYEPIVHALRHPLDYVSESEAAWRRYHEHLESQLDEPVFEETFTLRDIYVPLRATTSTDLTFAEAALHEWIDEPLRHDALRVISGGPGSGKSSLTKVFAADHSRKRKRRVLFVPLHLFDLHAGLEVALTAHFSTHHGMTAPLFKSRPRSYLVIFDGLDELVMQGKSGPDIARGFVADLARMLERWNGDAVRIAAIVTGREILLQAIDTHVQPHQILSLMPFRLEYTEKMRISSRLRDPLQLAELDQRHLWWQRFGELKQKPYRELPAALQRDELEEISSQPLLNYLLALAFERGRIDFEHAANVNAIYADLLDAVYERGWSRGAHESVRGITRDDFGRVLEEIAVAAWKSNGRVTTALAAAARCQEQGLAHVFEGFAEGMKQGVGRLLTAFYFRYGDRRLSGERTFEFTHKSFSEYLLARRIVREAARIAALKAFTPDVLERWTDVCDVPFDSYVHGFVMRELQLLESDARKRVLAALSILFTQARASDAAGGKPLGELRESVRRRDLMLLCALSACAAAEGTRLQFEAQGFDLWLHRTADLRRGPVGSIVMQSLSRLEIDGLHLSGMDFGAAILSDSILRQLAVRACFFGSAIVTDCDLQAASIVNVHGARASFTGSNLTRASIMAGDWSKANFERATLEEASLDQLRAVDSLFTDVRASKASFKQCDLAGAVFNKAILRDAQFVRCHLQGASFRGADLSNVVFDACDGFDSVDFTGAVMTGVEYQNAGAETPQQRDSTAYT